MRNNTGNRIIIDPAGYDALLDQVAKDIKKKMERIFSKCIKA